MRRLADVIHDAAAALDAAGIEDARLEAELLLAHATGSDRAHVLARLGEPLSAQSATAFAALVARRAAREPLAYIVGACEFYGLRIACAPGALIPRPETEMLVDLALEEIAARAPNVLRVADVGTGSGAIACAVAAHAPTAHVVAIDRSAQALAVARSNVDALSLGGRIELRLGNLLDDGGAFDVILANLPYVSEDEWPGLEPEIARHEPKDALVSGPRGTEAIERLLDQAPAHLATGGMLAAEIGCTQARELADRARARFPDAAVCVMKDFAGLDRMLVVRRSGADERDLAAGGRDPGARPRRR